MSKSSYTTLEKYNTTYEYFTRELYNTTYEYFTRESYNSNSNIQQKFSKYAGKKDYVIICSSGPSLNDLASLKQKLKNKGILNNAYVIALKSSINYLKELDIKVDFFATNFIGAFLETNKDIFDDSKTVKVCLNFEEEIKYPQLKSKCDYLLNPEGTWGPENAMSCVINDRDSCMSISDKNNVKLGHVFMELGMPIALMLKPKKILTIGWDISNSKYYNNQTNFVKDCGIGALGVPGKKTSDSTPYEWARTQNLIKFSSRLPKYLKKHHNISIYKLSDKSCAELPIFNL